MEFSDGGFCPVSQVRGKSHIATAFAGGVENRTLSDLGPEYFFEAKRLGTELHIIVFKSATFALLVLNWDKDAIGMTLHDVALAGET